MCALQIKYIGKERKKWESAAATRAKQFTDVNRRVE